MRYVLKISYDGSKYSGFQVQNNKDTIQDRLENAISQVLKNDIKIVASGRTDAGVSAILQVCHFDFSEDINVSRTKGYMNTLLPSDIRILDIYKSNEDFHARYSAKSKTYEYWFYTGENNIPVYDKIATKIGYNIDIESMKSACEYIIGEHDFSCFCASNTNVKDKTRKVFDISIVNISDNLYKMVITGNGFLYNMVRIIMGTLVSVGMGKIKAKDIINIIESKDRSNSGKTMPSLGLYLKNINYS